MHGNVVRYQRQGRLFGHNRHITAHYAVPHEMRVNCILLYTTPMMQGMSLAALYFKSRVRSKDDLSSELEGGDSGGARAWHWQGSR